MTLRSYWRFLRPLRSLAGIVFYVWIARTWGRAIFRLDPTTTWLVSVGVALPLILGAAMAGALHEPMHRPFILLLPNGVQRLRRFAIWAVFAGSLGSASALLIAAPTVPPLAAFGLAVGLAALPCIDRHRSLGGVGMYFVLTIGWVLFTWLFSSRLAAALERAPWAFFIGGLILAAGCVARGFSRRTLRQRADTMHVALQTAAFSFLFNPRMMSRRLDEFAATHARTNKRSAAGRDWTIRAVGSATTDWMRVVWHAFAGRTRHGYWRTQLVMPAILLFYIFLLPFVPRLFQLLAGKPSAGFEYWRIIAVIPAADTAGLVMSAAPLLGKLGGLIHAFVASYSLLLMVHPQLPYPISRTRMARVVFGLSLAQITSALVLPAGMVWACSLLGQAISGQPVPGFGLPGLLETNAALLVALPWFACAGAFARPIWRVVWATLVGFPFLFGLIARELWAPQVFTAHGASIVLALSAAGFGLLWWRLHRHYRGADLVFASSLFNPRLA